MAEAFFLHAHMRPGIGGALIVVIWEQAGLWINAAVGLVLLGLPTVIIHLLSAVSAEDQAGKGIGNASFIRAVNSLANLLRQLPCIRINDGFMRVFDQNPFL